MWWILCWAIWPALPAIFGRYLWRPMQNNNNVAFYCLAVALLLSLKAFIGPLGKPMIGTDPGLRMTLERVEEKASPWWNGVKKLFPLPPPPPGQASAFDNIPKVEILPPMTHDQIVEEAGKSWKQRWVDEGGWGNWIVAIMWIIIALVVFVVSMREEALAVLELLSKALATSARGIGSWFKIGAGSLAVDVAYDKLKGKDKKGSD